MWKKNFQFVRYKPTGIKSEEKFIINNIYIYYFKFILFILNL